ncbi:MAG: farnesyl-diphosphate synthase [Bdellovibrionaceae bacterium]|nr:farnesyl-diphosphate synthase [Pseudobdellovibrionaceae bacterium]|tara:strand:+ start:1115 stop:1948 length:834 start_codon:yes stop_codon:yes gene_type:complete
MKSLIDEALSNYLNSLEHLDPCLSDPMRYSLLAPGKRIRPHILLQTAQLLKVSQNIILPFACAVETFHCFTLIHDDLPSLDDDDFRRGKPSNHKAFGEATAILAGDALLSLAHQMFFEGSHLQESTVRNHLSQLWFHATGPQGVLQGQTLEMTLNSDSTPEEIIFIHQKKTGLLFEISFLIPLALSHLEPFDEKAMTIQKFASEYGILFQIVDDFEDRNEENQWDNIFQHLKIEEIKTSFISPFKETIEQLRENFGEESRLLVSLGQDLLKSFQENH